MSRFQSRYLNSWDHFPASCDKANCEGKAVGAFSYSLCRVAFWV